MSCPAPVRGPRCTAAVTGSPRALPSAARPMHDPDPTAPPACPAGMNDRVRELGFFLRVSEEASFSAAARSLDLDPSTISKVIQRLENRLGVRLFHRTSRVLQLTQEGEQFLAAAQKVMTGAGGGRGLGGPRGRPKPPACCGCPAPPAFARRRLAPLMPAFVWTATRAARRDSCWRPRRPTSSSSRSTSRSRAATSPTRRSWRGASPPHAGGCARHPPTCNAPARRTRRPTCCSTAA
jgi:hypothetical protein